MRNYYSEKVYNKCAIYIILLVTICLVGCHDPYIKAAHERIAKSEYLSEDLLNIYCETDDKYLALCYLIANASEYDLNYIYPDSLREAIDCAVETWANVPWSKRYKKEQFYNYVLPHTVSNEPTEYYWRWDIPNWLKIESNNIDMLSISRQINSRVAVNNSSETWGNPQLGYTASIHGNFGKCDDRAILTVMAMRSYGIPAAFEFIPFWGSTNTGHSVCSVILPNDSVAVFQNTNDDGENVFMANKTPKIYRRVFSEQQNTILYKYRDSESIPSLFSDFRLIDVTALHRVGKQDIKVDLNIKSTSKLAYLAVFAPSGWRAVAFTKNRGARTYFKAVGDGTDYNGKISTYGENIGDGIVYLPCYYIEDQIIPAANPIIVSKDGSREIKNREKEKISLKRKYPRIKRIINYADQMQGGVFEVSNKADFSDAVEIYRISETPLSRLQKVDLSLDKPCKYIRYRKHSGTFSLGELKVYDSTGDEIDGTLIATRAVLGINEIENIVDGDPLTYFDLPGGLDVWAGLRLDKASTIGYIEFCPRNDDNEISPGDIYELFYWDGEWKSLGEKTATNYTIDFEGVPKGALLWLRDLTRGKEERPFTYDSKSGEQIWW